MFAARKEFELCKLLATNRAALRVAIRFGLLSLNPHRPGKMKAAGGRARATEAAPAPDPPDKAVRKRRRSQRERKSRTAAAIKLQALAVGFLTRRKELPAARECALRRSRAKAALQLAVIREDVLAAQEAADHPLREGKRRVSFSAGGGLSKRSSSPLSSASSFSSACEDCEGGQQQWGPPACPKGSPSAPPVCNPFLLPWSPGGSRGP